MSGYDRRNNFNHGRRSSYKADADEDLNNHDDGSDSGCSDGAAPTFSAAAFRRDAAAGGGGRRYSLPQVYAHHERPLADRSAGDRFHQSTVSVQGKVAKMVQRFEEQPSKDVFGRVPSRRTRSRSFSAVPVNNTATSTPTYVPPTVNNNNNSNSNASNRRGTVAQMVNKFNKLEPRDSSSFVGRNTGHQSPKPWPLARSKSSGNIVRKTTTTTADDDDDDDVYCDFRSSNKKADDHQRGDSSTDNNNKLYLVNKKNIYFEDLNDRPKVVVKNGEVRVRTRHLSVDNVWHYSDTYSPPKSSRKSSKKYLDDSPPSDHHDRRSMPSNRQEDDGPRKFDPNRRATEESNIYDLPPPVVNAKSKHLSAKIIDFGLAGPSTPSNDSQRSKTQANDLEDLLRQMINKPCDKSSTNRSPNGCQSNCRACPSKSASKPPPLLKTPDSKPNMPPSSQYELKPLQKDNGHRYNRRRHSAGGLSHKKNK